MSKKAKFSVWFAGLSLKQKLTAALASCSLGASLFLALVISNVASRAIENGLEAKLEAISKAKSMEITGAYQKLKIDLNILGNSKFIQDALVSYESVAMGTGLDIENDADLGSSPYFKNI